MKKTEIKINTNNTIGKENEWTELEDDSKGHKIIEHEIKNQITVIASLIERIENYSKSKDFKKDINYIKSALHDCESLLSSSAANDGSKKTIINIHRLLKEAGDIFSGSKKISLKTKLYAKSHLFYGNNEIIKSALNNIIINAFQAQHEKGRIIIKTYNKKENIYIEISDKGQGIKAEIIQDIFAQGYTTKTRGSGIGLYSAKKNIELSGGMILVSSKEGRGAKFTIILPAYIE